MDARQSHVVKAEKARSLNRYRRNQRLMKVFLRVSEICVVLFLLAHYSSGISLSAAVASDSLCRLVALFAKPLSVFLLSNAIIVIVIVLSSKDKERGPAHDVYDEYVARQRIRDSPGMWTLPEETVVDKQIVLYSSPPVRQNPVPTVMDPEANRVIEKVPAVPSAKQCRRAQTMVTTRGQRELRLSPSLSENGWHDRAVRRRRACEVEELSDEEFNRRVEKYIERTRMFLQKEKMADAMKHSYKATGYHSV